MLGVGNGKPIDKTCSEPPEGEEGEKLDNMKKTFASTEKDERGPVGGGIGEVGGGGAKGGMNVVKNISDFWANEKDMGDTVL